MLANLPIPALKAMPFLAPRRNGLARSDSAPPWGIAAPGLSGEKPGGRQALSRRGRASMPARAQVQHGFRVRPTAWASSAAPLEQ